MQEVKNGCRASSGTVTKPFGVAAVTAHWDVPKSRPTNTYHPYEN